MRCAAASGCIAARFDSSPTGHPGACSVPLLPQGSLGAFGWPVRSGRSLPGSVEATQGTLTFPTFDPVNFPVQRLDLVTAEVKLPAWKFIRLIVRTQYAADEHAARYALGGCSLDFAAGKLFSVATDGRCLVEAEESATGTGLLPPKTAIVGGEERALAPVVPRKALSAFVGVLQLMENTELSLGFTAEGRFQATARDLSFTARMPEGRFPSLEQPVSGLGINLGPGRGSGTSSGKPQRPAALHDEGSPMHGSETVSELAHAHRGQRPGESQGRSQRTQPLTCSRRPGLSLHRSELSPRFSRRSRSFVRPLASF